MSRIQLGPRLSLVASYVPEKAYLGDIGTDHAYLPIYLWEQGKIQHAVAVDVHEGPYKSACSAIKSRKLESAIEVRFGDGLKPIKPGEVDTLTLAGMGGNTMLEIFAAKPEVMAKVHTLILQPQGAERKVRLTLLQEGWKLVKEELVEEDNRIYVVIKFSRDAGYALDELKSKLEELKDKVSRQLPELQTTNPEQLHKPLNDHNTSDYNLNESNVNENNVNENNVNENNVNENNVNDHDVDFNIFNKNVFDILWSLGPLVLEQPTPQLKTLIQDQVQLIERKITEMKKSTKKEVQERIKSLTLDRRILEGLIKCLYPSV